MNILLRLFIGLSFLYIDVSFALGDENQTNAEAEANASDGQWVEVEQSNILPSDVTGVYYLVPYRNRRDKWGKTVSFGYSSYKPLNYEPNFVASDFTDIYGAANLPLVELRVGLKRNFTLGSVEAVASIGTYNNASDSTLVESDLNLMPVRLGAIYNLDNLMAEPYVVPYVEGGIYTVVYHETVTASGFGGTTQAAPYGAFGIAIQLNWADRESARISYLDSGIENTFLYLEGRKFIASSAAKDPDFSTGIDWGAGVRLEF